MFVVRIYFASLSDILRALHANAASVACNSVARGLR